MVETHIETYWFDVAKSWSTDDRNATAYKKYGWFYKGSAPVRGEHEGERNRFPLFVFEGAEFKVTHQQTTRVEISVYAEK